MDFGTAMRIKHGKQMGNMDAADSFFGSLGPGQFKAMGSSYSKGKGFMKKKPLKFGRRPT